MPTTQEIREAIEHQLKTQLEAVPGPQDDWIRAGMDSLEVIDVLLKLETKFEQEIPVGEFAGEPTTDGLVEFLVHHLGDGSS
jgi:acyl carrier protein